MDTVKIKNIKTGAVKEVKKSLAGDYEGTGEWKLVSSESKKATVLNRTKEDK